MKKEIAFISMMMIFGIVFGFVLALILMSIAVPNYSDMLLTVNERVDFELMFPMVNWINKNLYIILGISGILAVTTTTLLFLNLNTNFKNSLKEKTGRLKAIAVILSFLVCLILLIFPLKNFFSFLSFQPQTSNIVLFFLFFFITGLLWFIAGEMGWAGDFSSWKMGEQGKKAKPFASFIFGGIVGGISYGIFYLYNWSFNTYLLLVSEVLDKSGEVSYLGFKLLTYELMFMSSMCLGIIAGLTVAQSPTYRETRQRFLRLIFPSILFVILVVIVGGVYQNAAAKYDLGKKSLADAVGVPEKATTSKTIVLFKQDKPVIQEWRMQANGNSFLNTYAIELSYENLKKIEDYIAKHKEGSVFNFAAYNALMNGYHGLWDIQKGIKQQFVNSELAILPRLLLLSRLRYLPVTPENLKYLKTFTDETKWHVGARRMLVIAEAFMHFGMTKEAKAWVNKAKEKGVDVSTAKFLLEPVLINGKISGTIKVNGKPLAKAKVALLKYVESLRQIEDATLNHRLVDVRELDTAGRFTFEHLGKEEYLIAIMTDKETIPYDVSQERFKVKNSPGVIRLDARTPKKNLGNINIMIK